MHKNRRAVATLDIADVHWRLRSVAALASYTGCTPSCPAVAAATELPAAEL